MDPARVAVAAGAEVAGALVAAGAVAAGALVTAGAAVAGTLVAAGGLVTAGDAIATVGGTGVGGVLAGAAGAAQDATSTAPTAAARKGIHQERNILTLPLGVTSLKARTATCILFYLWRHIRLGFGIVVIRRQIIKQGIEIGVTHASDPALVVDFDALPVCRIPLTKDGAQG